MHTIFGLLCFVVVIHWLIFPYPPDLLHWHCGNLTIAPVPAKQPWWIWINISCEFIMNDYITTTKQSTTKPCAYFLGYTVYPLGWLHRHWGYDIIVQYQGRYGISVDVSLAGIILGMGSANGTTALQGNVVSHWLNPYPEWSLTIILGMASANKRRCYNVTTPLIG